MNMIIDGNNLILGRVATIAAKRAMQGEPVVILNCEKMIVTGKKEFLLNKFQERQDRGHPYYGPYVPKMPDRLVRRTIRGMLPYKQTRGLEAFRRVKCYIGIPDQFKSHKIETLPEADYSKLRTLNFMRVGEYSKFYGKEFKQ